MATEVTSMRWQRSLEDYCQQNRLGSPIFSIMSDRRGGRTAWSASVVIADHAFKARYWYDGNYLTNAKEDAAEVALDCILKPPQ